MERREFGDSGLGTSVLGFGTWEMGAPDYGHVDAHEAADAVNCAVDSGITLFDTAEAYGPEHSERLLARALGKRRKDVVLVTKVGFVFDERGEIAGRDSSRDRILYATEGCLTRLDTDWIDLLLIHWSDHRTPTEESIGALEELKRAGKIRHYGVSNYNVPMMEKCQQHGHIAANQIGYNLFDRRVESAVLPYCRRNGIGFMGYGTLAFGLLSGSWTAGMTFPEDDWRSQGKCFGLPLLERATMAKELKVVERLRGFAEDHGRTVPQLALAWSLSNPDVTVALVGMRKPSEVLDNLEGAHWRLTREDKSEIDRFFEEEGLPTYVDTEVAIYGHVSYSET